MRLKELFLAEGRAPETPVGYVRQAGREEQEVHLTTLADFNPEEVDMFTVILIGNSQSYAWNDKFITPRGYYNRPDKDEQPTKGIGQNIMIQSFRTIESELKNKNIPLDHKWALLHAIHTTADFEMEKLLYTDKGAVEKLYQKIELRVDEMVQNGLIDEVKHLKEMGYHRGMVSMQGLGYKEILDYLDDKITLEEAVYRIKRDTRHFAKRQLTWFRRERDVIWVDKSELGSDTEALLSYMRPYYYSL